MPALTIPRTVLTGNTFTQQNNEDQCAAVETLLNTTKIDSTNIQTGGIATANYAAGSVDTTALGTSAVTAAKIADGTITGVKLNSAIVDSSTVEISSNVIRVKDAGITRSKLAALGHQISSSSGSFSTTSTSPASVTGLSVTLTASGRPVFLGLIHDGGGTASSVGMSASTGSTVFSVEFLEDSNSRMLTSCYSDTTGHYLLPPSAFSHVYVPAAGTYTYTVRVRVLSATGTILVSNCKLVAYEFMCG